MSAMKNSQSSTKILNDRYGRHINYLRLSVTDRCDLRCTYCMAEDMEFLPKKDVLSLEELVQICDAFIARGVRRIRLTGGEPLVRRDILHVVKALGDRKKAGLLDEVTLTSNGTQLSRFAGDLSAARVERINVSLDTLDPDVFAAITRRRSLDQVMDGIKAAKEAGLKIKVNMVVMHGINDAAVGDMLAWCGSEGHDLTLIETMPMGNMDHERADSYVSLQTVLSDLQQRFDLLPSTHRTGGPARYFKLGGAVSKLGVITPLSGNFCDGCNRVRVTCTGRIYMCLGQDDFIDLRDAVRGENPGDALDAALDRAMLAKPKGHDFAIQGDKMVGQVDRHMSHTGG